MPSLKLNDVTCIAVTSVWVPQTVESMLRCVQQVDFAEVKLVTHQRLDLPKEIRLEYGSHLKSLKDYSHYMIYNLHKHVETPYALIVQHDGYIKNPEKWRNDFYNYDYIGAVWEHEPEDPFGNRILVGNGGFSFRSRKLIELPQKVWVPWETNEGDFYKKEKAIWYGEDTNICVHNRHIYEKNGCKFAPPEVAVHFSQESQTNMTEGVVPFGYHRVFKN